MPSNDVPTTDTASPTASGESFPSNDLDRVSGKPDVQLLKALFQACFELDEELPILTCILRIHEHARQTASVEFSFAASQAEYHLSLTGNSAKLLLQFLQRIGNQVLRDRTTIIKLRRKQDFVAAQDAHKWLDLPH